MRGLSLRSVVLTIGLVSLVIELADFIVRIVALSALVGLGNGRRFRLIELLLNGFACELSLRI